MIGQGSWPEHGEIDILEDVNDHDRTSGTLHCGNVTQRNPDGTFGPCHETGGLGSGLIPCAGCETAFHTYTVVVDRRNEADQQIRWYLDDREIFGLSESKVGEAAWREAVDHGFSIILDVAIGGSYPDLQCHCHTPLPDTSSGAAMTVRYVDVYLAKAKR
jgi:beta-glucanase (GH16 family)